MTPKKFLAGPTTTYREWFGRGNNKKDYKRAVGKGRPPKEVYQSSDMLCLIWPTKIIVTGYDGSEYRQSFEFKRKSFEFKRSKP